MKKYYVYIMMSFMGTLYIGVTNDIHRRVREHKNKNNISFTKKYSCTNLVYYEEFSDIGLAIRREKQLKKWVRRKKFKLIKMQNPELRDLFEYK